jgi:uncharacterized protein involved in exopolysaccharide biosynthesis
VLTTAPPDGRLLDRGVPRRMLEIVRGGTWPILLSLVMVPVVAVTLSALSPTSYRVQARIQITGFNTGTLSGDFDQAQKTLRGDLSLSARTLDSANVGGLQPIELQRAARLSLGERGVASLAINRPVSTRLHELCAELAYQLANDQRGFVVSDACRPSKVSPQPLQSGLLAIGIAIPLGIAFAAGLDATRRRSLRPA